MASTTNSKEKNRRRKGKNRGAVLARQVAPLTNQHLRLRRSLSLSLVLGSPDVDDDSFFNLDFGFPKTWKLKINLISWVRRDQKEKRSEREEIRKRREKREFSYRCRPSLQSELERYEGRC